MNNRVTLAIGAFTLPLTTRLLGGVRRALVVACMFVGTGYLLGCRSTTTPGRR